MTQKTLVILTTGVIILATATPAFAGGKHHNYNKHNNRNMRNSSVSQNINVFQKGYKNVANIVAKINFGGW